MTIPVTPLNVPPQVIQGEHEAEILRWQLKVREAFLKGFALGAMSGDYDDAKPEWIKEYDWWFTILHEAPAGTPCGAVGRYRDPAEAERQRQAFMAYSKRFSPWEGHTARLVIDPHPEAPVDAVFPPVPNRGDFFERRK
ncbi:hypothetical protein JF540_22725 [Salipiger thiooxidans]|uniref:hypothetical protein n=1 Tax=Salipiger thiooxidans TaxID=282683 RepID=UPI001A8FC787|nr:hypothetical protein [Salipiger thiooxidans]MBN8189504.1 hypothetical protein [Salipiger thiooxidans]